jgi:hypothetical protein
MAAEVVIVDLTGIEEAASGPHPPRRARSRSRSQQQQQSAAAAAADVPAEAVIDLTCSPRARSRPASPPLPVSSGARDADCEDPGSLTARSVASAVASSEGAGPSEQPAGGSSGGTWPRGSRVILIPLVQLCIWLAQLWAILGNLLLVAPLRLLRAPAPVLRGARAVAHRPLIVLSVALAAPLYLNDVSYGLDFDALPGQRAATMADLAKQV